jgi:hypothetical protein
MSSEGDKPVPSTDAGSKVTVQEQLVYAAVQEYLANGWFVYPIASASERLTGRHKQMSGKLPVSLRYYFHPIGTPKEAQPVRFRSAGVGIVTGQCSNLVVLDVDTDEAMEKIREFCLPDTRTVKTPRGKHYYFRHPGAGYFVPSNYGLLWQGIDVKGEGAYVVAPPSWNATGGRYYWLDPDTPIADLPASMLELLQTLSHRPRWKRMRSHIYQKYFRHPVNALTGL